MKALYKLHFESARDRIVTGLFVAEKESMDELIKSGKDVYFGEVFDNHIFVSGAIEDSDVTLVATDENLIKIVEEFNLETGYNPFDYLED